MTAALEGDDYVSFVADRLIAQHANHFSGHPNMIGEFVLDPVSRFSIRTRRATMSSRRLFCDHEAPQMAPMNVAISGSVIWKKGSLRR